MRRCFFKYYKNFKLNKVFEILKLKYVILNIYYSNINKLKVKKQKKIFCIETGKTRSVDSFFLLYRMNLKKNLSLSKMNGLKKIS